MGNGSGMAQGIVRVIAWGMVHGMAERIVPVIAWEWLGNGSGNCLSNCLGNGSGMAEGTVRVIGRGMVQRLVN